MLVVFVKIGKQKKQRFHPLTCLDTHSYSNKRLPILWCTIDHRHLRIVDIRCFTCENGEYIVFKVKGCAPHSEALLVIPVSNYFIVYILLSARSLWTDNSQINLKGFGSYLKYWDRPDQQYCNCSQSSQTCQVISGQKVKSICTFFNMNCYKNSYTSCAHSQINSRVMSLVSLPSWFFVNWLEFLVHGLHFR